MRATPAATLHQCHRERAACVPEYSQNVLVLPIILLCDSIYADRTEDTLYAHSPREPPNRTGFISQNIF